VTGPAPATSYDLPYEFAEGDCTEIGICTVTDGRMGRSGTTTNLIGTAVIKPGFWGYQLIPGHYSEGIKIIDQAEPMLMFGGTAYEFGSPSGRLFTFDLTSDVLQDSAIGPFGLNGSSPSVDPNKPLPEISPLLYLEKDGGPDDQSNAVWLQTSFYIKTTYNSGENGEDPSLGIAQQDSYINVALGTVDPETGGLIGQRRGGSHIGVPIISSNSISYCDGPCNTVNEGPSRAQEAYAFSGNIATLSGPDGSHFLGTENPNMVIGFDSTESHVIGQSTPLVPGSQTPEQKSGSAYHIGIGRNGYQLPTQNLSGPYSGYATGMVQSEIPASAFQNQVASASPDDLTITFNPVANTLSGSITVRDISNHDGATEAYTFGFGGNAKRSAYIDDKHYAAIESVEGTSVLNFIGDNGPVNYENVSVTSYLVSADQLNVTKFFPETFGEGGNKPICKDCDFLQWGAWGARVQFSNAEGPVYVDNIHLGWWVAGDVIDNSDLPTDMTASYAGHVIGNVSTNIGSNGWQTYVATGDMDMNWDFNARSGDLTISHFDRSITPGGLTFTGAMSAPGELSGKNKFGGPLTLDNTNLPNNLSELNGMTGSATGSFVRGPDNYRNNGEIKSGSKPQGVIGNWNVGSARYNANGIFAGSIKNN
jgi:hypothetical protein